MINIIYIALVAILAIIAICLGMLTWVFYQGIHSIGEDIRTEVSLVISQEIRRQDDRIEKRVQRQAGNNGGQEVEASPGAPALAMPVAPGRFLPETGTSLDQLMRGR